MHHRSSLLALAAAAAGTATASSSSSASTITTTFFNLGPGITPVASIIAVNATFSDLVTYLINCPPEAPAPTTTATPLQYTDLDGPNGPYTTQPLYQSSTCLIPTDGMTLVAGPSTMRLEYTNTHTPADITKTYDCTITEHLAATTLISGTAAAASATKTIPAMAFADCDTYILGGNETLNLVANYPYFKEMAPLVVTAGVEKLAAARGGGKAVVTAAPTGSASATSSAADASASSSRSAAVGRFDVFTSVSVVGAAGFFFVTIML